MLILMKMQPMSVSDFLVKSGTMLICTVAPAVVALQALGVIDIGDIYG